MCGRTDGLNTDEKCCNLTEVNDLGSQLEKTDNLREGHDKMGHHCKNRYKSPQEKGAQQEERSSDGIAARGENDKIGGEEEHCGKRLYGYTKV